MLRLRMNGVLQEQLAQWLPPVCVLRYAMQLHVMVQLVSKNNRHVTLRQAGNMPPGTPSC